MGRYVAAETKFSVTVKNTFVDVTDPCELSPGDHRLRVRACSDPGLFEKACLIEREEMEQYCFGDDEEIVMTGLDGISDAETEKENYRDLLNKVDAAPDSASDVTSTTSSDIECEPDARARICEPSLPKEEETIEDEQKSTALEKEVERLASENARLAEQNRLLSEKWCEFTNLAVGAQVGAPVQAYCAPVNLSALPPMCDFSGIGESQTAAASSWWSNPDFFQPQLVTFFETGEQHDRQFQHDQQAMQSSQHTSPQQVADSKTKPNRRGRRQGVVQRTSAEDGLCVDHMLSRGEEDVSDSYVEGVPAGSNASSPEVRTTVMLRNLPNNYTRSMLLALIDAEGFAGQYDFVYLPMDFNTRACLGYAFVNLMSSDCAQRFWTKFDGYSQWVIPSKKHCGVSWSNPHQGLQSNIDRYRNSPVMYEAVPDEYKPMLFVNGKAVPFPGATKKIRAPRIRNYVLQAGVSHRANLLNDRVHGFKQTSEEH